MAAGLQRAVQRLVNGTSSHFVPQPTPSAVLEDALIGLIRFFLRMLAIGRNIGCLRMTMMTPRR
jgi:hypothetical protein